MTSIGASTPDPGFRAKLQIAAELARTAKAAGVVFRAVAADCAYGDQDGFRKQLASAGLPFVMALKPSHGTWAYSKDAYTPVDAARALTWTDPEHPGEWTAVERTCPRLPTRSESALQVTSPRPGAGTPPRLEHRRSSPAVASPRTRRLPDRASCTSRSIRQEGLPAELGETVRGTTGRRTCAYPEQPATRPGSWMTDRIVKGTPHRRERGQDELIIYTTAPSRTPRAAETYRPTKSASLKGFWDP
ncbi:transposase [Streptomyces sp. NPDC056638]|uniref:transposase n=1 Tax=Streptomyces sp. NPDC056638 TaxID=3345887 RepID=UPI0036BEA3FE